MGLKIRPKRLHGMKDNAQHGTILVVDDNGDIRALAKVFLERNGYLVATASDGEEALRYYEAHRPNILLLLTDVTMPNMNGLVLADRVLGIDSQLPIIFMSGDAWSAYRGFKCIEKPFRSAELLDKVSRTLDA